MRQLTFRSYLLLLYYLTREAVCTCQGPHLNLCGSQDNITEIEDFESIICDCQEVIFCWVIELTENCNATTLLLDINNNVTISGQLQCDVTPLNSQAKTPNHIISDQSESQVIIEIVGDFQFGKFKIVCLLETSDGFVPPAIEWEIVEVHPTELAVDSEAKLLLTVKEQTAVNSPFAWCFLNTPDNDTELLSTFWISKTQIECLGFKPVVPGLFSISLSSMMTTNIFEKSVTVKVKSKHPVAQKAEYSSNSDAIFIYFDSNIELHSSSCDVFSKETQEYFGKDFNCYTKGDVLLVKMGSPFQFVDNVSIAPGNKICRAGSQGDEFCLPALPANLPLLKPKGVTPSLSLYSECNSNSTQELMSIKVMTSKQPASTTQNETLQVKSFGKTQRKNLMLWRTMRRIQRKLSSQGVILQTNPTEVEPLLESISFLENALDAGDLNPNFSACVSVSVQPSFTTSSLLAEARISFRKRFDGSFRYKWVINEKDVFETEKLLTAKDLAPGKYIIKCSIVDYNSTEILGQGWATTEIQSGDERIFIIPSEITVNPADNISLHAMIDLSASVSWTCRTALGKLCTTVHEESISKVIDLNSRKVSIPAGTLPVGEYVWTVESGRGSNEARVFIKPGNVSLRVEIEALYVEPSQNVVLHGSIKQMQQGCYGWWSSVRQKGFSYLRLRDVERNEKISPGEDEIPLVITPGEWKKAEPDSSYMFRLQVLCQGSQKGSLDYVKVPLRLSDPPGVPPVGVEPLAGKAMITEFAISSPEADADAMVYEWSYADSCDERVPLKRGAFPTNYKTYLPPGDLKLILKVCDGNNICSETSSPLISVIQEAEFPAENFYNSLTQIRHLTMSGDTLEGFGLAVTVLKSLSLLAETEVRERVFSTIEEVIKIKTEELTEKMRSGPKAARSALEFFERAVAVAKYFRKGSDILVRLNKFKNEIPV